MKTIKFLILISIHFHSFVTIAQKQGFVWYFPDSCGLDFNFSPPKVLKDGISVAEELATTISDKNGRLLFYMDRMNRRPAGLMPDYAFGRLINKNHQPLLNSDSIQIYLSSTQGFLILPLPNNNNTYYIFHQAQTVSQYNLFPFEDNQAYLYSIVDINLDNGLGGVISKNNLFINKKITEKMLAIKHGNGRDWWVILHGVNDVFYRILFTPDGINFLDIQNIGPDYDTVGHGYYDAGQMISNSDGTQIAMVSTRGNIDIFDFDRCSGYLSNWKLICNRHNLILSPNSFYGCSFSPNNRYLYVSELYSPKSLYQLDLLSSDIFNSKKTIYQYADTNIWGQMKIAPDNKIYIISHESEYIHIIHNPNEEGVLCNFEENALWMEGKRTYFSLPNIPNFNLGPLIGSACDTLSIVQPEDPQEGFYTGVDEVGNGDGGFRVYPNPASSILYIDIESADYLSAEFSLYNALGQEIMVKTIEANTKKLSIDISKLKTGFYNYTFNINNERIAFDKIIVIR